MSPPLREGRTLLSEVLCNQRINKEIFSLDIAWAGPPPGAGQFFLVRPERTSCFLSRPISVAFWDPAAPDTPEPCEAAQNRSFGSLRFMIALRGKGTAELSGLQPGDKVELTGPLGNAWTDFLPDEKSRGKIALIGGGIGIAPLIALALELQNTKFDFYAGFKTLSSEPEDREYDAFFGRVFRHGEIEAGEIVLATEDGGRGSKGLIPGLLDPGKYHAVCACGPEPMLKAVRAKCAAAGVPCFISLERRMACGVGACLGCTVKIAGGNKRCCTDGPVFPAAEILFDG
ncbi:MAG: dihydroorotate dehydrogenase electron transfer subunit [Treponema sp.]|jgi:NAD(P)H-flavin reductase|nr:dihydroorotate dehydrogenase electron transfer subunit [Treponema sp.]